MEAQNNRKRISKIAVKSGVPLDAANKQGQTALHYCYGYGYFELGEYLAGPAQGHAGSTLSIARPYSSTLTLPKLDPS